MISLPATFELKPHHAGKRVERVLLRELSIREPFLLMLIHRGKVLLDGRPLKRGERVPGAGRIEILPPDPRSSSEGPIPNAAIPVSVRHEDPDIIVVEKPSGLAMHPGPQHGTRSLQNALVARYPELVALGAERNYGLVQRLDKGVSGVVVVARSVRAHEALVHAFTAREPEKRYRALLLGTLPSAEGKVASPVEGRDALTEWKLLNRTPAGGKGVALVVLHPVTGRKHQLRIHLASIGCPILGDKQHGPGTLDLARAIGLGRIALHAESLAFDHPVTGARMSVSSPWPIELENAWLRARRL